MSSPMFWYALQVVGGFESKSKEFLQQNFPQYHYLLPARHLKIRRGGKIYDEIKPLFSGYLFLGYNEILSSEQGRFITQHYAQFGPSKSMLKILGTLDSENYAPIHPDEMEWILRLTENGEVVGISQFKKEGNKVIIINGALKGQEAIIKKIDARKNRITVELTMLGQKRLIDFAGEMLSPTAETG